MSQGEGEKAVKIMKKIAHLNGREVIWITEVKQKLLALIGASVSLPLCNGPVFKTKT